MKMDKPTMFVVAGAAVGLFLLLRWNNAGSKTTLPGTSTGGGLGGLLGGLTGGTGAPGTGAPNGNTGVVGPRAPAVDNGTAAAPRPATAPRPPPAPASGSASGVITPTFEGVTFTPVTASDGTVHASYGNMGMSQATVPSDAAVRKAMTYYGPNAQYVEIQEMLIREMQKNIQFPAYSNWLKEHPDVLALY